MISKTAFENLTAAVTTINTPMPIRIDEATLLACLRGEISERKWRVRAGALEALAEIQSAIPR